MPRLSPALTTEVVERSPYGPDSEHSYVLDAARTYTTEGPITDTEAEKRLHRFEWVHRGGTSKDLVDTHERVRIDKEIRAISSGTLGGLIPSTIPPFVSEAVAYGLRSTAPLANALENLPLPPVGVNVAWAKTTTATTVTNQTAENTAITASADTVVASATDPLRTIAANADFSAQTQEMSGGWFDAVIGEELGRAFGARLEQQIWNGAGSSGELKGFAVMTGNSSTTAAGQTLANQTAAIAAQFSAVSVNLGSLPDLIAMAPRRYADLQELTAAIGLPMENVLPGPLRGDVIISPAAPTTLGAGSEDWIVILNRASTPLVRAEEPTLEFQRQGPSAGTNLTYRWLIYGYCALGVSRRPEGVGLVKGITATP